MVSLRYRLTYKETDKHKNVVILSELTCNRFSAAIHFFAENWLDAAPVFNRWTLQMLKLSV